MEKPKRIFVQLGLDTELEFAYYGYTDIEKRIIGALEWAMHPQANQEWTTFYHDWLMEPLSVVGVDMNPTCIKNLEARYAEHSNISLLNFAVTDKDDDIIQHNGFNFIVEVEHPHIVPDALYETPTIRLKTLLELILKNHLNGYICGLAMDIEYAEYMVIEDYDFSIKPTFVKIEAHSDVTSPIVKKMLSAGYEILMKYANFMTFIYYPDGLERLEKELRGEYQ